MAASLCRARRLASAKMLSDPHRRGIRVYIKAPGERDVGLRMNPVPSSGERNHVVAARGRHGPHRHRRARVVRKDPNHSIGANARADRLQIALQVSVRWIVRASADRRPFGRRRIHRKAHDRSGGKPYPSARSAMGKLPRQANSNTIADYETLRRGASGDERRQTNEPQGRHCNFTEKHKPALPLVDEGRADCAKTGRK
jgi:hypothetical protein